MSEALICSSCSSEDGDDVQVLIAMIRCVCAFACLLASEIILSDDEVADTLLYGTSRLERQEDRRRQQNNDRFQRMAQATKYHMLPHVRRLGCAKRDINSQFVGCVRYHQSNLNRLSSQATGNNVYL